MTDQGRKEDYLNRLTFVAFDTETTGLWAPSHRIVEIGAVKFRLADTTTERFQSLVNPGRPMPEDVIAIHGITDRMVADAEPAGPVLEHFFQFCGSGSVLIAHNAPFDISFLYFEMDRCALKAHSGPILDTVDIYRRFFPGPTAYSLETLSKHFRIAERQQHRALADAELVHALFRRAVDRIPPIGNHADLESTLTVYDMASREGIAEELPSGFEPLKKAVELSCRVEMVYSIPGIEPSARVVRPRQFYVQGSQYYMQAFCERANTERTFRLDRITEFKLLKE